MRVSAGMNARLPLRSPLPHNRLNSLYAGLFVVKLNARHWHTHTHAHGPIVPSDLLTSNPGDSAGMGGVKQKSQRMCVCVTGAELFFFFFLSSETCAFSPLCLWLFWTHGRSVRARHTSCAEETHIHHVLALFATETFGFSGGFQETNMYFCKGWIVLLIRTQLASLKPDLCPHYQQTMLAVEETQRPMLTYYFLPCHIGFYGRCVIYTEILM